MSFINYKPEILVHDKWISGTSVFPTKRMAEVFAFKMLESWGEAVDYRATETIEPVNATISPASDSSTPIEDHSHAQYFRFFAGNSSWKRNG